MSGRDLKRKATVPSKSKAKAAPPAATGLATSRVPHGSSSTPAPNLAGFSNGMAAPFVGRGNSSSPTPNPSTGSIHPHPMADVLNSSPIHGRRGYPVGFGTVGSSHGRCGGSISTSSPPFGHQSSWDPAWDNSTHPPGGFMGLFNNRPHLSHNSHLTNVPSQYTPFKAPKPADIGGTFASMDAAVCGLYGLSI